MQKKMLILITIIMMLSLSLYAGTTGRLAGRVKDEKGQPVAYANVMLKGTEYGITTDESGKFILINIKPGVYTVKCFLVGYAQSEIEGVRISADETKTLNITLSKKVIEGGVIKVIEKEQMIKKDKSGSEKTMSSTQLDQLGVASVDDAVSTTAGVTKSNDGELHVRGGRATEVAFTVDGMAVSDPVDGGRALSVDMDAVADMKVMTGAFTAEYGNAQSGIVNIVTKDGSENYEGKVEYNTDHLVNEGANLDEFKFAIGGPVFGYFGGDLRKRLTFFLNGAGQWEDTRFRKHYVADPNTDIPAIAGVDYEEYNPYESRDEFLGIEIGNRNNNNYNLNLKLKYVIDPLKNVTFAIRGDRSYSTPYNHSWKYALQHFAETKSNQRQYLLTYDHTIGTSSNLKLKASYYSKKTDQNPRGITKDDYLFKTTNFSPEAAQYGYATIDNDGDGIYDLGDFNNGSFWRYYIESVTDPRAISNFQAPGSIWTNFIDDKTSSFSLRGDWEWVPSQFISFKSGVEIIQHNIEKNQLAGFLTINEKRFFDYLDAYGTVDTMLINLDTGDTTYIYFQDDYFRAAKAASGSRDGYRAKPIQSSYYLQDKMEWEGMIVNLGVRFDMWYLGESYEILQEDNSFKKRVFKDDDRFQMMISPRLGVSHPISEYDVMHFAYNYQNQLPQMQYIFTSKEPADAYTDGAITVGNPTLEPQITVTYEVGLQHQFNDDYAMDINTYFKNIYNYVSTKKVTAADEANVAWYEFISEDYGSARGIDLSLTRNLVNFISGQLSYSLAWAQGNNSDVVIQDFSTNLREFPLDWDVRHNMSLNLTFSVQKDEQFFIPFTSVIVPMDNFSATLNLNYASGAPYTPATMSSNGSLTLLETNSKRKESTSTADLRLTKTIPIPKSDRSNVRLTFTIENLFKKTNINNVYAYTGSPYYDGADLSETNNPGFTFAETQSIHDLFTKNPGNVNGDRNFILGISYNF